MSRAERESCCLVPETCPYVDAALVAFEDAALDEFDTWLADELPDSDEVNAALARARKKFATYLRLRRYDAENEIKKQTRALRAALVEVIDQRDDALAARGQERDQ